MQSQACSLSQGDRAAWESAFMSLMGAGPSAFDRIWVGAGEGILCDDDATELTCAWDSGRVYVWKLVATR